MGLGMFSRALTQFEHPSLSSSAHPELLENIAQCRAALAREALTKSQGFAGKKD